jgi:hypothetical protein
MENLETARTLENYLSFVLVQVFRDPSKYKVFLQNLWELTALSPANSSLDNLMQQNRVAIIRVYGRYPRAFFTDLLRILDSDHLTPLQYSLIIKYLQDAFEPPPSSLQQFARAQKKDPDPATQRREEQNWQEFLQADLLAAWQGSVSSKLRRRTMIEIVWLRNPSVFQQELIKLFFLESTSFPRRQKIIEAFKSLSFPEPVLEELYAQTLNRWGNTSLEAQFLIQIFTTAPMVLAL